MAERMIEDVDGRMVPAPAKVGRVEGGRLVDAPVRARDCYVVMTAELAPIVRGFVDDWRRARPADGGKTQARIARSHARRRRQTSTMFSPYAWLEQESGVRRETLRDISRGPRRRVYTPLSEADAIVKALEMPQALTGSGALRVLEHPRGCGHC